MHPLEDRLLVVSDLELAGIGRRAMSRSAAAGTNLRLRQGVYVDAAVWAGLEHEARHLVRIFAFNRTSGGDEVFSHWSAAAVHGLPVLRTASAKVDITVGPHRARGLADVRAHRLPLPADDVTAANGVVVTSLARTAIDIAAEAPFAEAVVVADAVLRRLGPDGARMLADAAARAMPRRAHQKIQRVLAFADERSESPAESVSRVTMRSLRLPAPELQHEFWDADGLAARVDFWFRRARVVGEMDGKAKYVKAAMNGGDPAQVVYDEKLREDRVRLQDVRFARWGWPEAVSRSRLGARLAAVGVVPEP